MLKCKFACYRSLLTLKGIYLDLRALIAII